MVERTSKASSAKSAPLPLPNAGDLGSPEPAVAWTGTSLSTALANARAAGAAQGTGRDVDEPDTAEAAEAEVTGAEVTEAEAAGAEAIGRETTADEAVGSGAIGSAAIGREATGARARVRGGNLKTAGADDRSASNSSAERRSGSLGLRAGASPRSVGGFEVSAAGPRKPVAVSYRSAGASLGSLGASNAPAAESAGSARASNASAGFTAGQSVGRPGEIRPQVASAWAAAEASGGAGRRQEGAARHRTGADKSSGTPSEGADASPRRTGSAVKAKHAFTATRAVARKLALQAIYRWLLNDAPWQDVVKEFGEAEDMPNADPEYFRALVEGVWGSKEQLNGRLTELIDRPVVQLDPVEHAVLLIGIYELSARPEVPYRVAINEAVGLAKRFGATDGHKFVNAVLDRAARMLRPDER